MEFHIQIHECIKLSMNCKTQVCTYFQPHAFANLINFGVSMEAMVLSPHAFVSEILRPEALKVLYFLDFF